MSRLSLAPLARQDLDSIWDYIGIECDRPDAADRLTDRIITAFEFLMKNPEAGERRGDLADLVPGIRSFTVGNYVIYYQPAIDGVRIGRVLHAAREPRNLLVD